MKRKKLWMNLTIMCMMLSVAFTFDNQGIYWLWKDHQPGVRILGFLTVFFALMWIRAVKKAKID